MPDWLFEGRTSVYVLLAAAAFLLVLAWWQRRQRYLLLAVAGVAGLAGLYFLLDRLVETGREEIVRKVRLMAEGVTRKDLPAVFEHISEQFRSP